MTPVCRWIADEDGNWQTDCGKLFVIFDGTPADNQMKFCCYCGKPIREKKA
jgi:rRNA maturation endonuclease Nob1